MKIYITIPDGKNKTDLLTPSVRQRLEALGQVEENTSTEQIDPSRIKELAGEYDALIASWGMPCIYGQDILNSRLKFIGYIGGSLQGIVDESVFDTDIHVVSGNSAFPPALAESSLLMMLMSVKRWHEINYEMKYGDTVWNDNPMLVESLYDKAIGILGFGQIAKKLILLLKPFGVEILVADDYVTQAAADEFGFTIASVDEVCTKCDIISIHHTLTKATYQLLNRKRIALLKPTAIIVNTARGKIIDQQALIERLQKGELFAALDVFEKEPLDADSPLRSLPNTILIPHMGGKTAHCRRELANVVLTQLEHLARGEELTDFVTREMLQRMTAKG